MKLSLIIAVITLTSVVNAEEFKYNQKVRVIDGFFTGCTGTVKDMYPGINEYIVHFDKKCDKLKVTIAYNLLESIK